MNTPTMKSNQIKVYNYVKEVLGKSPSLKNFPTEQECSEDLHSAAFAVKTATELSNN